MRVIVLLSGGIDSMACVKYYESLGYDITCVFFDYGQPSAEAEKIASELVAHYFNVDYQKITITGIPVPHLGEICGRNSLLVFGAFTKMGFGPYKIAIGIHAGTTYSDCSPQFVEAINKVLDIYSSGTVILEAPFLHWGKNQIITYCLEQSLPTEYTYSCEAGTVPPCGKCLSCLDRKEFLHD